MTDDFTAGFPPATYDDWRALVDRGLKGADYAEQLVTLLADGIAVQPLYSAGDVDRSYADAVAATGVSTGWTIRQRYEAADPETVRAAIADDLGGGVEAIELAIDHAFRAGLDMVGSGAIESVGVGGVAVSTVDDLAAALADVDLATTPLAIDAGNNVVAAIAFAGAVALRAGIDPAALRLTVRGDIPGGLCDEAVDPTPLDASFDDLAASVRWATDKGHRVVGVSTRNYDAAGASPVDQLAFAIAGGIDTLRHLDARGIDATTAALAAELSISVDHDIFTEIARLRAARVLWARVLEACGAEEAIGAMRVHAETSRRVLARRDPWVNMLRATSQTFAAVAGGADSIATAPFDGAIGEPDALARRVARNTQLVLRLESNLGRVRDPAAGSWYVEWLTGEIAASAWRRVQEIEAAGGMCRAVCSGVVRSWVERSSDDRARAVDHRERPILGVSTYPPADEAPVERPSPDVDAIARAHAARRAAARRDDVGGGALDRLSTAGPNDLVAVALEAAASGASAGQIADALGRGGLDPWRGPFVPFRRDAERFESVVDRTAASAGGGADTRVFVASVGTLAETNARATWVGHFLRVGGFEPIDDGPYADPEAAAAAFAASGARSAVINAPDAAYPNLVPALAPSLSAAGARRILLAGRPSTPNAGVDEAIHVGSDVRGALLRLLESLEVM